jgi:hypothetical protein
MITAVLLALDRAARVTDAEVTRRNNFVRTAYPEVRGLDYRGRYDGVYCDFSVTVSSRPSPTRRRPTSNQQSPA